MPNHIKNILKIKNVKNADEIIERFTSISKEEGRFLNFEKIIPMPKELLIESSFYEEPAIKLVLSCVQEKDRDKIVSKLNKNEGFKKYSYFVNSKEIENIKNNEAEKFKPNEIEQELGIKTLFDLGIKYIENLMNYSYTNWYDWCIENWGTKWNSYENQIITGKNYIKFIFETAWATPRPIFNKLSQLIDNDMEIWYADEDIGSNCGKIYYINSEEKVEYKEGNRNFARRVWEM